MVRNILFQAQPQSDQQQQAQLSQTSPNPSETSTISNIMGQRADKQRVRSNSAPDCVSSEFYSYFIYNYFILSIADGSTISIDLLPRSVQTQRDAAAPLFTTTVAYDLLDNVLSETRDFPATASTSSPSSSEPPPTLSSNYSSPASSSDKSLSAVEAIVSKYLTPKAAGSRTTKRVIKRPYGVSVTNLDIAAENAIA